MNKEIIDVFGEGGLISNKFSNYKVRESQLEGIEKIMAAINTNSDCLLEGPCGFGKTYAYLFPSLLKASTTGDRVVIATSGIALQDQLVKKDLPFMADIIKEYTENEVRFTSLKGKNNYVCKREIAEIEFSGMPINKELEDIISWAKTTTTGEVDELGYVPDNKVWMPLSCQSKDYMDCKLCSHTCFNVLAREKAKSSQVVVCNYHILLSDIEVGRTMLGTYDILICDEAHELPSIARDFFSKEFSLNVLKKHLERFKMFKKYEDVIKYIEIENEFKLLIREVTELFKRIKDKIPFRQFSVCKNLKDEFYIKYYTDELVSIVNIFREIALKLFHAAEGVMDFPIEYNEKFQVKCELETLREDILDLYSFVYRKMLKGNIEDNEICYVENNGVNISFHMKYKKVGNIIKSNILERDSNSYFDRAVSIFTSATLSTNNTFKYIKENLGFEDNDKVVEFIGSSPFNLSEQELWLLPSDAIEGNKSDFNDAMVQIFASVCEKASGGVLGLFTSTYNMNLAYKYMSRHKSDIKCISQADVPKSLIARKMQEEDNLVVIGTKSLFTGVDVPGQNLRVVFIDKLPFPNVGDPVNKALSSENGGFYSFSIPEMIISLKQAVGRGVRTVTDKCVICIADNRLATANYKTSINRSFSYKKKATRNIEDITDFLA